MNPACCALVNNADDQSRTFALLWLEYLTLFESYDRTLPGWWGRSEPDMWVVSPSHALESVAFSRYQNGRLQAALATLLGGPYAYDLALRVVEVFLEGATHVERLELLAGRSPMTDLVGPSFFVWDAERNGARIEA